MEKLNIGIVCYPTYGGSGVIATELGKALADRGHKVHFVTYKQPFRLDSFHPNINYHEVSFENYSLFQFPPYETALASSLVEIAKFEKLDIIHVHYAIPHASAAFLAKKILLESHIHIPYITTLHGTDITLVGKNKAFLPVVEFSINQSDGITAVSEYLKQSTLDHFKVEKDIRVIYNFINPQRFSAKELSHIKKLLADPDEKVLIHVSNFRKVKRTEDVIKIFGEIVKKVPSKLMMIGDGPERNICEELCRKLSLCDKIRFMGKQESVEELYTISDLMIMPSESESFGLAALEAMACRVPVVSSDAGGLPELIENGYNGYMSPVGDIENMAKQGIEILENNEKLNTFKDNAYETSKKFHISNIIPQYESYYYDVLKNF